jgi:chromatin assembly factor 1 subunit A
LGDASTSTNGTVPAKKRGSGTSSQSVPKTTIPDSLLPEFIAMVHGSTSTRPVLVDEVYQALKDRGAKKNAVEAKFKEIAVKEKGTKKWVVSEEVRKSVGLV